MNNLIYLDYAATTPVDTRVAERMAKYLTLEGHFGNAASTHGYGQTAKRAIDEAREQVANWINASPDEILWTSGATESINLALKGAAQLYQQKGKHIITMKTEHKAVLDTCEQLEKSGFQITYLAPEANGLLNLDVLKNAILPETIMIAVMHINNETGVMQDIHAIAELASQHQILFLTDAAQSGGKIKIDVQASPIDLIAFSAHKIYGPKGVGALYVRRKPRVRLAAQLHGGGQEQGMRAGTLATHQIVGMGEAFRIANQEWKNDLDKIQRFRKQFLDGVLKRKDITLNGHKEQHYPGIINLCFHEQQSDSIMQKLPHLAVSSGSACLSKGVEPSYVLRAMGLSKEAAQGAIRFSFGRFTTEEDVAFALREVSAL